MPRGVDVALSLAAAVALFPIFLLIAGAHYILTGRLLFRQVRIGRALKPFVILKFQTMVEGADRGSSVAVDGDRRITAIGRFLRSTKLDELPQLLNVLRGEMSLVGPRALPPAEVAHIPRAIAAQVYAVRPGLTGLASLMLTDEGKLLGDAVDPEEHYFRILLPRKTAWELIYAQRRSLWFDALILLSTPAAILFPEVVRRVFYRLLEGTSLPSFSHEKRLSR